MPSGGLQVGPGEIKAFYCYMDENQWKSRDRFYDDEGNRYPMDKQIIVQIKVQGARIP